MNSSTHVPHFTLGTSAKETVADEIELCNLEGPKAKRTVKYSDLTALITEMTFMMIAHAECFPIHKVTETATLTSTRTKSLEAMKTLIPAYHSKHSFEKQQAKDWVKMMIVMYGDNAPITGNIKVPLPNDAVCKSLVDKAGFSYPPFKVAIRLLDQMDKNLIDIATHLGQVADRFYEAFPQCGGTGPDRPKGSYFPAMYYFWYILFFPGDQMRLYTVGPTKLEDRLTVLNDIVCLNWLRIDDIDTMIPIEKRKVDMLSRLFLKGLIFQWLDGCADEQIRLTKRLDNPHNEEYLL